MATKSKSKPTAELVTETALAAALRLNVRSICRARDGFDLHASMAGINEPQDLVTLCTRLGLPPALIRDVLAGRDKLVSETLACQAHQTSERGLMRLLARGEATPAAFRIAGRCYWSQNAINAWRRSRGLPV